MNSLVAVVFFAAVAAASAGVIHPAGLVASTYSAPAIVAPVATAYGAPLAHHHLAYSAPLGHVASEDTVVAGPSGTVATSKTIGAPAVAATYAAPHAYSYAGVPHAYSYAGVPHAYSYGAIPQAYSYGGLYY
ncbi:pupal cuticle protein C1B-like [Harmonia axyridis]|uniref:pupal cuticle protein C1B-like n=1 Tax=Harmonia axyridis TaxID=115357 RepID=UPI001E2779E8|nr:pupal cuticle protein C1B-like [Harmonia axyridis]